MTTPCFGKSAIFDSTAPDLHRQAAAICAGCPSRLTCSPAAHGAEWPEGTWAGLLYGATGQIIAVAPIPGESPGVCELPECFEPVEQPKRAGGRPMRYCSSDHRNVGYERVRTQKRRAERLAS